MSEQVQILGVSPRLIRARIGDLLGVTPMREGESSGEMWGRSQRYLRCLDRYGRVSCSWDPGHATRTFLADCGLRLDDCCAPRRRKRLYARYWPRIIFHGHAGELKFLTVTFGYISQPIERQEVTRLWRIARKFGKELYPHGVASLEMKYSFMRGWNIHVHFLVVGRFYPQRLLSQRWEMVSGCRIVDIRRGNKAGLGYMLKYATKGDSGSSHGDEIDYPVVMVQYQKAMWKRHQVVAWGDFATSLDAGSNKCRGCPVCGARMVLVGYEELQVHGVGGVMPPPSLENGVFSGLS